MTAEIAILNTGAVALAADSAVTVSQPGGQKIFSSANKIFALTNDAPVGILVYGNANFMGIPMETLIKEYRKKNAGEKFPTIAGYTESFIDFLLEASNRTLSQQERLRLLIDRVRIILAAIRNETVDRVQQYVSELMRKMESVDQQRIRSIWDYFAEQVIDRYHSNVRSATLVKGASNELLQEARSQLGGIVAEMRRESFGSSLSRSAVGKLNEVVRRSTGLMLDDVLAAPGANVTGVVIAGFGEDEVFPGYVETLVDGCYGRVLRTREGRKAQVSIENEVAITPFAQADMFRLFMLGLHPLYLPHIHSYVQRLVRGYGDLVLDRITNLSSDERKKLDDEMEMDKSTVADLVTDEIEKFGRERIAAEIALVVRNLPKDQLAELAEALVNLTSLRRRVSLEKETVGGPTDVAVITKGEGLVWTKRKHYFPPELNVSYLARVYAQAGRENHGEDSDA